MTIVSIKLMQLIFTSENREGNEDSRQNLINPKKTQ